jgi:hypothetical protein
VPVVAVLSDGDRQLQALRELMGSHRLLDSRAFRLLSRNPGFVQAQVGLRGVAASAELDAWSAVSAVLGRELAVGLVPRRGKQPAILAVSIPRDAKAVNRLLEVILALTGIQPDEPAPDRSSMVEGVRVFRPNADSHLCRIDGAVLVSSDPDLMAGAIRSHRAGSKRLADADYYRSAETTVPRKAVAWLSVDLVRLREVFAVEDAAERARMANPLGGFLFGGWWHSILHAERAAAWVLADAEELRIETRLTGVNALPESYGGFSWKESDESTWAAADLAGFLGEVRVARDWPALFSERESILTLPAAGDLVNFSNVMTTLLGQLDFVDELLPTVDGPVRFVMAQQDFSTCGYTPTPKLPAFALVVPLALEDESDLPRRLHSGSQTALALVNADAGQKQQPTFLLDVDRYKDVRIVFAEYPRHSTRDGPMMGRDAAKPKSKSKQRKQEEEAGVEQSRSENPTGDAQAAKADPPVARESSPAYGIRYNFAPAAAVVGDEYVIATSLDLLHSIIDAAGEPKAAARKPVDPAADTFSLSIPTLLAILRDNRRELTAQRMLEKDMPRRQARREIDAFLELLEHGDRFDVSSRLTDHGYEATLSITLRKPSAATP